MTTLLKLGNKLSDDKILCMRLVALAQEKLKDTSHQVKTPCLQLISELYPVLDSDQNPNSILEAEVIVKLLADYTNAEVYIN